MVTGSTSGIGLATARGLAELGATVIVVGRSAEKANATVTGIQVETGSSTVEWMQADLSVQAQVRALAQEFQSRHSRLDVLVNNAGGFFMKRQVSADGIEMNLALNLLSPFLLTNLLLEMLEASAPARIVNTSSDTQTKSRIDFEDLEGKERYRSLAAYGQSKLAILLFTYELARRLDGIGVTANAVHPGFVATGIGMGDGWMYRVVAPLKKRIALSPEEGAQTGIYLASSPEVEGITGEYFVKKEAIPSSPASYDEAAARRLWEICEEMTGL
jgi:NAD(P)-dependent dehydrogenase (short-subunit alcohol dehydrogenase family)